MSDDVTDVRTVRSFCRICTSVCGILVDVAGDEVVRGARRSGPPVLARLHVRRRGARCRDAPPPRSHRTSAQTCGSTVLQPTTWDECLDDLGSRLRAVIDAHGPEAVGVFFGSGVGMDAAGYRMAQALYAALGTPARFSPLTIDGTAKVLVSDLVGGFRGPQSPMSTPTRRRWSCTSASNPVVSHGHTAAMPDPVSAHPGSATRADVWVVDPAPHRDRPASPPTISRRARVPTTRSSPSSCARSCATVPTAHMLERRTVGSDRGARGGRRALHAGAHGPDRRRRRADLTGCSTAVRRAGRVAIVTGTGVTMSASANVTQWLAWALMIVTDSMNRPGGVWFHPGFGHQLEAFQAPGLTARRPFGPGPSSRPEARSFMGEWPCAVLADEIRAGNIRAVLNLGGHLLTAFPDANDLEPALRDARRVRHDRDHRQRHRPRSRRTCCPPRISSSAPT